MTNRQRSTVSAFLASLVLASVMLAAIATVEGCRHNVNTNNPKVIAAMTLLDASDITVTVEDGLVATDHILDTLQTSDPEYYAKIKPLLKKISSANVTAAQKIKIVKDGGQADWKGAILAVAASVNVHDLNAVGIKNPNTQIIVSASLATLVKILTDIPQKFGGAS